MGDLLDLLNSDGTEIEEQRILRDPGATVGDVLTVNADKTVSAAPGGGSQTVNLVGPYPVDHTDFAGGAYLTPFDLFVPVVGTFVLGLWLDPLTAVDFNADSTQMGIGQDVDLDNVINYWATFGQASLFNFPGTSGDVLTPYFAGTQWHQAFIPIVNTHPVTVIFDPAGSPVTPPTTGHMDLYFLIATPTAP